MFGSTHIARSAGRTGWYPPLPGAGEAEAVVVVRVRHAFVAIATRAARIRGIVVPSAATTGDVHFLPLVPLRVLERRKPMLLFVRDTALSPLRHAEREFVASLFQLPPRRVTSFSHPHPTTGPGAFSPVAETFPKTFLKPNQPYDPRMDANDAVSCFAPMPPCRH